MDRGLEIVRGKTKALYEHPGRAGVAVMVQSDKITAGNGAREDELPGKGRYAALTTSHVFRLLNLCGLPTHYLRGGADEDQNEMLVRRCEMIPIEVVIRGVAAGSLITRHPSLARGSVLAPRVIEYFLKDDARNDPLVSAEDLIAHAIVRQSELSLIVEMARIVYEVLNHAWRLRDVLLVDLKIEFGRILEGDDAGKLVIADVIDNDSWRIWPQGREELMLDKQLYRNLAERTPQTLANVGDAYARVAEMSAAFAMMRPAMVVILAEPTALEQADRIAQSLTAYGIPYLRRATSFTRMPGHLLSVIQQLDVTFPRLVYVTVGSAEFGECVDHATPAPVYALGMQSTGIEIDAVALRVAKGFALDDSILYGRTMLMEVALRGNILQADMHLYQAASSLLSPGELV